MSSTRTWNEWIAEHTDESEDLITNSGDSRVQREVEPLMMRWLSAHVDQELRPRRFVFPDGSRVEVDGVSPDLSILCEAWAHQGSPKSAQKAKVMSDAMKLIAVSRLTTRDPQRLILLLAGEAAARPFKSGTWRAAALHELGLEVVVAVLPEDV